MRRIALCLLLLTSLTSSAQEIAPQNRIKNRSDFGVCWFACAESVGKQYGIKNLTGLTDKVVSTGIGWKDGATKTSIEHWMTQLKVVVETKTGKDPAYLVSTLRDRKLPVLVAIKQDKTVHAVAVLKISEAKISGDFLVTYYDCNFAELQTQAWNPFWQAWTGEAHVFDPKSQPQPPRLTLVQPVVPVIPLPLLKIDPVKQISNQDLKDGVTRPADTLYYLPVYPGNDYYQQFKGK